MVCIAACDVSGVDWVPRENRGGSDGGGPWFVKIEYFVTGPGEDAQM